MKAQLEIVTIAQAKEYLERRLPNRTLSERMAARYAADMREGRWTNNGQPIIFDEFGNLLDGQHRLRAIILAQMPIAMMVTRGVPSTAMETMDTGRARTLSDVLHMQGTKNTVLLSATARVTRNYAGGLSFNYTPSKAQLLAFIKAHPSVEQASTMAAFAKRPGVVTLSPLAALIALATNGERLLSEAKEFIDGVAFGEGLWKGDARLVLRNWVATLRQQRSSFNKQGVSEPTFGALIRAWNAYAQGRELTAIKLPPAVNRETVPIFGFDQRDWPELPDQRPARAGSPASDEVSTAAAP